MYRYMLAECHNERVKKQRTGFKLLRPKLVHQATDLIIPRCSYPVDDIVEGGPLGEARTDPSHGCVNLLNVGKRCVLAWWLEERGNERI